MMRIKMMLMAALFTTAIFAQEKPKIISAGVAIDQQKWDIAKARIDEADAIITEKGGSGLDEKTMGKFLFYKGEVYLAILYAQNEETKALDSDPLPKCADAYLQLIEFEKPLKKKKYTSKVLEKLPYVGNGYINKGAELADANDFGGAKAAFLKAYEIKSMPELGERAVVDTSMLFNAAIMSMKSTDFAEAAEIFEKLVDMGYNGYTFTGTSANNAQKVGLRDKADAEKQLQLGMITEYERSESLRASTYISLISCYKEAENDEKYKSTLKRARAEFPDDVDLINLEIQDYLDAEQYDEALAILDEAIAQAPDNKLYYYVKGSLYQNHKNDIELALENYNKALEIDPGYLDALYMCGLVYVERANAITEEINELSSGATKKYNELKAKQKETFAKALPYFEKAHEVNPDDLDTIKALREVYYKTGDKENFAKMNALLNG